MSLKYILIAAAVLIALCGADVSEIKADKIELPFNDLLPPLQDETSTTSTTTTTTLKPTITLATKPTKKSYYQKPTGLVKDETPKPQLSLDLLPPFEDEPKPAEEKPQPVVETTPKPVLKVTQPTVVKVAQPIIPKVTPPVAPKVIQPAVPKVAQSAVPKVIHAAAPRPQYSVHPAPQVVVQNHQGPDFRSRFQSRFSNYFLTSTVRPRRGPLPTITPFPRYVRL
ncbi:extensin isoform X2 [Drosophila ficusphila]|uniref:extensin isoform X2 n=1 Tax=Drosophila ficusphila TaxID=30025 RepID=UPI0007E87D37|nr:extensin isoform X2 [Drosophila ficusphila]